MDTNNVEARVVAWKRTAAVTTIATINSNIRTKTIEAMATDTSTTMALVTTTISGSKSMKNPNSRMTCGRATSFHFD